MTSSITALTTTANFSRATAVRSVVTEDPAARANASSRRDSSERVIEGELLRQTSPLDFSIDDIIGVQADIRFDPRFSSSVTSGARASNDAIAAYASHQAVFTPVRRQVDTFV